GASSSITSTVVIGPRRRSRYTPAARVSLSPAERRLPCERQLEREARPCALAGFHPHRPAHLLDEAVGDEEAEPRPRRRRVPAHGFASVELLEDPPLFVRRNPDSFV